MDVDGPWGEDLGRCARGVRRTHGSSFGRRREPHFDRSTPNLRWGGGGRKSRRPYSLGTASACPSLEPLIAGRINVALIRAHWPEILPVATSKGWNARQTTQTRLRKPTALRRLERSAELPFPDAVVGQAFAGNDPSLALVSAAASESTPAACRRISSASRSRRRQCRTASDRRNSYPGARTRRLSGHSRG